MLGVAFLSIYEGWYILYKGDKYGKEYNGERTRQNQPLIEDYFTKKPQRDKQLTVWSDTTESHTHVAKSYYTNLIGNLLYESDSFKPAVDSAWLKKKLTVAKLSELDHWRFNRTYYPGKGVDSYYFLYRFKGGSYRTITVSMSEGDSLYRIVR